MVKRQTKFVTKGEKRLRAQIATWKDIRESYHSNMAEYALMTREIERLEYKLTEKVKEETAGQTETREKRYTEGLEAAQDTFDEMLSYQIDSVKAQAKTDKEALKDRKRVLDNALSYTERTYGIESEAYATVIEEQKKLTLDSTKFDIKQYEDRVSAIQDKFNDMFSYRVKMATASTENEAEQLKLRRHLISRAIEYSKRKFGEESEAYKSMIQERKELEVDFTKFKTEQEAKRVKAVNKALKEESVALTSWAKKARKNIENIDVLREAGYKDLAKYASEAYQDISQVVDKDYKNKKAIILKRGKLTRKEEIELTRLTVNAEFDKLDARLETSKLSIQAIRERIDAEKALLEAKLETGKITQEELNTLTTLRNASKNLGETLEKYSMLEKKAEKIRQSELENIREEFREKDLKATKEWNEKVSKLSILSETERLQYKIKTIKAERDERVNAIREEYKSRRATADSKEKKKSLLWEKQKRITQKRLDAEQKIRGVVLETSTKWLKSLEDISSELHGMTDELGVSASAIGDYMSQTISTVQGITKNISKLSSLLSEAKSQGESFTSALIAGGGEGVATLISTVGQAITLSKAFYDLNRKIQEYREEQRRLKREAKETNEELAKFGVRPFPKEDLEKAKARLKELQEAAEDMGSPLYDAIKNALTEGWEDGVEAIDWEAIIDQMVRTKIAEEVATSFYNMFLKSDVESLLGAIKTYHETVQTSLQETMIPEETALGVAYGGGLTDVPRALYAEEEQVLQDVIDAREELSSGIDKMTPTLRTMGQELGGLFGSVEAAAATEIEEGVPAATFRAVTEPQANQMLVYMGRQVDLLQRIAQNTAQLGRQRAGRQVRPTQAAPALSTTSRLNIMVNQEETMTAPTIEDIDTGKLANKIQSMISSQVRDREQAVGRRVIHKRRVK